MENTEQFIEEVIDLANILFFQQSAGATQFALPKNYVNNDDIKIKVNKEHIDIKILLEQSKERIEDKSIKARLCAALKSTTNDLIEIAKVVIAVLLPLSLAPHLLIPTIPIIYAGISLVIYNAGVKSLCL